MARSECTVAGFRDQAAFLRDIAERLRAEPELAHESTYPAGEYALRGPAKPSRCAIVAADVSEDPRTLFRVCLLSRALRASGAKRLTLVAPWIAYGRQDRACEPGASPAGIVVAEALSASFDRVRTLDAHSPAFVKAFGGKLENLLADVGDMPLQGMDVVVAPDTGASIRAKRAARMANLPLAVLEKHRVAHRVIVKVGEEWKFRLRGKNTVLIDDMADSGQTLLRAADALREAGVASVSAFVTHALDADALRAKTRGAMETLAVGYDHKTKKISPGLLDALVRL